ncbi:MAG: hypothetical protein ACREBG_02040, partial [Pyrinomonadaceae bacterium]
YPPLPDLSDRRCELPKATPAPITESTPLLPPLPWKLENIGDRCYCQYEEVDIPTCRAIGVSRGTKAAARCYASAAERVGACLAGKPMPPLDTWNN